MRRCLALHSYHTTAAVLEGGGGGGGPAGPRSPRFKVPSDELGNYDNASSWGLGAGPHQDPHPPPRPHGAVSVSGPGPERSIALMEAPGMLDYDAVRAGRLPLLVDADDYLQPRPIEYDTCDMARGGSVSGGSGSDPYATATAVEGTYAAATAVEGAYGTATAVEIASGSDV